MLNKYTWIFYMALLFNWQRILSSHERRRKRRNVRTFFKDKAKGSRVLYSICLKKKKQTNKIKPQIRCRTLFKHGLQQRSRISLDAYYESFVYWVNSTWILKRSFTVYKSKHRNAFRDLTWTKMCRRLPNLSTFAKNFFTWQSSGLLSWASKRIRFRLSIMNIMGMLISATCCIR